MRVFASLLFGLALAIGAARAEAPLRVEGCGAAVPARIDSTSDFSTIGIDGAEFRATVAPRFLRAIGALCQSSPKHRALIARRVRNVVLASAPGAEDDVTVYLSGRTLRIEILDPAYNIDAFPKALAIALERGSVAQASFDCAKAAAPVEKLICSDGDLAAADAALGETYRGLQARDKADPAKLAALRAAQKEWVAGRDRDCLANRALAALDPASLDAVQVVAYLTAATNARAESLQVEHAR